MSLWSWTLSNFLWIHGKAIYAEAGSECVNSWPELNCYAFGLFGLNLILHLEQRRQKNTWLINRFKTNTTDRILTIASSSSTETEHLLFIEHLLGAQNCLLISHMPPLVPLQAPLLTQKQTYYSHPHFKADVTETPQSKDICSESHSS